MAEAHGAGAAGGALRVEPTGATCSAAAFPGAPVTRKHRVCNVGKARLGLKVKCTDNAAY